MSTSTLTSKGQTTIPKDVRKRLNLHPGDRLEFVIDEDGRVLVLPASVDASELAGMLKRPAKPVTVTEMNHAIRKRGGGDDRDRHECARQAFGAGVIHARHAWQHRSSRSNARESLPGLSTASCSANLCGFWRVPTDIRKNPL